MRIEVHVNTAVAHRETLTIYCPRSYINTTESEDHIESLRAIARTSTTNNGPKTWSGTQDEYIKSGVGTKRAKSNRLPSN